MKSRARWLTRGLLTSSPTRHIITRDSGQLCARALKFTLPALCLMTSSLFALRSGAEVDRGSKIETAPLVATTETTADVASESQATPETLKSAQRLDESPRVSAPSRQPLSGSRGFWDQVLNPTPLASELNTGRLSDTLFSLFPGVLVHGFGHWHRGDIVSAKRIMLLEGLGIISILGGYTLETLVDRPHRSLYLGERWLYHSGGALLLASWLTDVIGSFRGDVSRRSLSNEADKKTVSFGYRYRDDIRRADNHHWVAELQYETGPLRVFGALNWEFDGEVVGGEGGVMGRVYRSPRRASNFPSQLELGVRVRRWMWTEDELTQWIVTPQLEGTLSLDSLSPGLRGYALFHCIGVGWERFELTSFAANQASASSVDAYPLMMESGLKLQPYPTLALTFSVLENNTLDLRPLNHVGQFVRGQVLFKQSEQLSVTVNTLWGLEWSTWAMVNFTRGGRR